MDIILFFVIIAFIVFIAFILTIFEWIFKLIAPILGVFGRSMLLWIVFIVGIMIGIAFLGG